MRQLVRLHANRGDSCQTKMKLNITQPSEGEIVHARTKKETNRDILYEDMNRRKSARDFHYSVHQVNYSCRVGIRTALRTLMIPTRVVFIMSIPSVKTEMAWVSLATWWQERATCLYAQ